MKTSKRYWSGCYTGLLLGTQLWFVIFKLTGVIDWSWWIIFLPAIVYFGVLVFLLFLLGLIEYVQDVKRANKAESL